MKCVKGTACGKSCIAQKKRCFNGQSNVYKTQRTKQPTCRGAPNTKRCGRSCISFNKRCYKGLGGGTTNVPPPAAPAAPPPAAPPAPPAPPATTNNNCTVDLKETNPFKILDIPVGPKRFTKREIILAYRKRSVLCHPDKGGSKEQFQKVNEAREQATEFSEQYLDRTPSLGTATGACTVDLNEDNVYIVLDMDPGNKRLDIREIQKQHAKISQVCDPNNAQPGAPHYVKKYMSYQKRKLDRARNKAITWATQYSQT